MSDFGLNFEDLGLTPDEKGLEPEEKKDKLDSLSHQKAVKDLIRNLRLGKKGDKLAAAWQLSKVEGDAAVVNSLVKELHHLRDEDVLLEIISALGHLADESSIKALVSVLSSSESTHLRRKAAWAISNMKKSDKALGALEATMLSDSSPEVRVEAAWGIGNLNNPKATGSLVDVLIADQSRPVRKMAVWALGEVGEKEVIEFIERALEGDPDPEVRREAAWVLGRKKIKEAKTALSKALYLEHDKEVIKMIIWALGKMEDETIVKDFEVVFGEDHYGVEAKKEAAYVLGRLKIKTAAPLLLGKYKDAGKQVKEVILWSLGKIADYDSISKLRGFYNREKDKELKDEITWVVNEIKAAN
ncbi:HEAT repeat domain-containing protein [Patescibacteria group bacterium]|nr:HEAT repeat domain-containing protein [Patescibacteria group bacterium]